MDLILSLFPGLGFFDLAFEHEGFCVVRGPDLLWGIGGPPCQAHSAIVPMIKANGYQVAEDLIPEFERVIELAAPKWWIMENVPRAPIPKGASQHILLTHSDCSGSTSRKRRFSWFGLKLEFSVTPQKALYPAITCDSRKTPIQIGGSGKRKNQTGGRAPHEGPVMSINEMLTRQGFDPYLLDHSPFSIKGKKKMVGNAVPFEMGLTIARAVKTFLKNK